MKRWLITLSFAFLASAAHALPTVTEVQAEIQKGNYAQAQTMMREVVVAKPGNAKAHYIYAEILAHNARFADSAEQARLARELDPAIKFTSPEKFRAFEQLLEREQQRAKPSVTTPVDSSSRGRPAAITTAAPTPLPERSQGVPSWVWIAGLAGLGFVAWRMLGNRKAANSSNMAAAQSYGAASALSPRPNYGAAPIPNAGQNFGPGAGPGTAGMGGMGGGMGSGMMGVGLGVAGGLAAGMLAEKLLHGGHDSTSRAEPPLDRNSFADTPTPDRNNAAQALEDRSVDFGNGNDWGDAGSSDAGSVDMGSGDGDGW